jgi:hypothetical protein
MDGRQWGRGVGATVASVSRAVATFSSRMLSRHGRSSGASVSRAVATFSSRMLSRHGRKTAVLQAEGAEGPLRHSRHGCCRDMDGRQWGRGVGATVASVSRAVATFSSRMLSRHGRSSGASVSRAVATFSSRMLSRHGRKTAVLQAEGAVGTILVPRLVHPNMAFYILSMSVDDDVGVRELQTDGHKEVVPWTFRRFFFPVDGSMDMSEAFSP